MRIFNRRPSQGELAGEVMVRDLPPHFALTVNALVLRVPKADSAPVSDAHACESICIKDQDAIETWPLKFSIQKPVGFYYVGLSVIAFRLENGKGYAQVERFFPMGSPCSVTAKTTHPIALDVRWPDIPLDKLGSYGIVHPKPGLQKDAGNEGLDGPTRPSKFETLPKGPSAAAPQIRNPNDEIRIKSE